MFCVKKFINIFYFIKKRHYSNGGHRKTYPYRYFFRYEMTLVCSFLLIFQFGLIYIYIYIWTKVNFITKLNKYTQEVQIQVKHIKRNETQIKQHNKGHKHTNWSPKTKTHQTKNLAFCKHRHCLNRASPQARSNAPDHYQESKP